MLLDSIVPAFSGFTLKLILTNTESDLPSRMVTVFEAVLVVWFIKMNSMDHLHKMWKIYILIFSRNTNLLLRPIKKISQSSHCFNKRKEKTKRTFFPKILLFVYATGSMLQRVLVHVS